MCRMRRKKSICLTKIQEVVDELHSAQMHASHGPTAAAHDGMTDGACMWRRAGWVHTPHHKRHTRRTIRSARPRRALATAERALVRNERFEIHSNRNPNQHVINETDAKILPIFRPRYGRITGKSSVSRKTRNTDLTHTHTQIRVRSALDHTRRSIYTREHGCQCVCV